MRVGVGENGGLVIEEAFNPVTFKTAGGGNVTVTQRDGSWELTFKRSPAVYVVDDDWTSPIRRTDPSASDASVKVRRAIGLLSAMVRGGERHSDESRRVVKEAVAAMDHLEGREHE